MPGKLEYDAHYETQQNDHKRKVNKRQKGIVQDVKIEEEGRLNHCFNNINEYFFDEGKRNGKTYELDCVTLRLRRYESLG